jgi:hypothetical protein
LEGSAGVDLDATAIELATCLPGGGRGPGWSRLRVNADPDADFGRTTRRQSEPRSDAEPVGIAEPIGIANADSAPDAKPEPAR